MPIVHAAQELPCTSYGGQHSQQLQKPRSIHKPFSNAHSAGLRKQHVRGFHHLSRSRDKESSSDRTTSSSKADRDLWQTEGLSKRQSLLSASAFLGLSLCRKAYAFEPPPQGEITFPSVCLAAHNDSDKSGYWHCKVFAAQEDTFILYHTHLHYCIVPRRNPWHNVAERNKILAAAFAKSTYVSRRQEPRPVP